MNESRAVVKAIRILNRIRQRRIYEVFRAREYRQVNPALWRRRLYERASAPTTIRGNAFQNPLRADPFRRHVCVYIMLYMWVIAPRAASRSRSRLLPLRYRRYCCGLPIIPGKDWRGRRGSFFSLSPRSFFPRPL